MFIMIQGSSHCSGPEAVCALQDDAQLAREKAAQLGTTVVEAAKDGKQYIEVQYISSIP